MDHELQVSILKELMTQLDEGKNIDVGVQYKMPTTSYTCPEIAAKERESFFQNHPQVLGLSGDLPQPASYLTNDDFGTPVLATRDKTGQFGPFLTHVVIVVVESHRTSVAAKPFSPVRSIIGDIPTMEISSMSQMRITSALSINHATAS